jgi:hypothetical protein
MSDLRKQLDALKNEYNAARYPGNLAEELLDFGELSRVAPSRQQKTNQQQHQWSRWRIGGFVTFATGIAAAILISLLHTKPILTPPPGKPIVVAVTQPAPADAIMPVAEMSTEEFPQDVSFMPTSDTLMPSAEAMDFGSMPSFPSLDLSSLSSEESS